MPKHKTLNVHPSLLPLLRGPAPIERSILEDMQNTGVTIMRLDEGTDTGPIVAQEKMKVEPWPMDRIALEKLLAEKGGKLLVKTMPMWVTGKVHEQEQDHDSATHTKKIEKEEAELDMTGNPRLNLLKVKAFYKWPKAFFFDTDSQGNKKRIIVTDAHILDGVFNPLSVIPEGGKEIHYQDYLHGKK